MILGTTISLLLSFVANTNQQEASDDAIFFSLISSCDVPNIDNIARDACLKKSVELIRDEFAAGRSFFGIPRIEPFQLEKFSFIQQENNVNMNATFTDIYVDGFSKFKILNIQNDYERKTITLEVGMDKLNMDGLYTISGNLLLLPLNGNGKLTASIDKVWVKAIFNLEISNVNQKRQIQMRDVALDFRVGKFNVFLTGLQVDDPVLEDSIIHFINNNNQFILNEIEPEMVREMSKILEQYMNFIFQKVPVRLIYPEDVV